MLSEEKPKISFACFLATEGGRKCPQCGKYAKRDELGSIGGYLYDALGRTTGHISAYGHLPGFGCNKRQKS